MKKNTPKYLHDAVFALVAQGWTDAAICQAMRITPRWLRALRKRQRERADQLRGEIDACHRALAG